ncbi:hypothetical protein B0H63DRAFT_529067 [Podospora didyma]|uniref:Uncharacterized protein n=1 Tax=Podospora didyma TaxID=330526 RepID=A0AAE0K2B9_9PEZI|nr:hypothetical protein B0H63DRAFT_529067 [Podospora didyma]
MPPTNLYWREFTRDGSDDVDHVADAAFLSANFVDFFGNWLQQGSNSSAASFHDLLTIFWNGSEANPSLYKVHMFMVADGSFVTADQRPKAEWFRFNPHVRLAAVVSLPDKDPFSTSQSEWTLCIVASSRIHSEHRFLQVAAWNGLTFRFYQRDQISGIASWNLFGSSTEAFGERAYLGPFNGHVNGAIIMKELHDPWIHWFNTASSVDFTQCFSPEEVTELSSAPYITQPGGAILSQLTEGPGVLEDMITTGVSNWFKQRQKTDFFDASSKLLSSPRNIPRWVAHLLLTTTINIVAARMESDGDTFQIPLDHFYDNELLQNVLGNLLDEAPTLDVSVNPTDYQTAIAKIGLSMLQEVTPITKGPKPQDYIELPTTTLGFDKRDRDPKVLAFGVLARNSEGQARFNILQSSFEDAQGVSKMQQLKKQGPNNFIGLFSRDTFNAIMMLDFWNPVYSWRRGILMQYVPQTTTWNGTSYDLETRFIQNVSNSPQAKNKQADSPEFQFLQLLKVDLATHQKNIAKYFAAVHDYVETSEAAVQALVDYLSLAESRRRIYRPLPLDEFGSSMPYALKIPADAPPLEMTASGRVQTMPARGQDFLKKWTSSLAGVNPRVVPDTSAQVAGGPLPISALPRPSLLSLPCQSSLDSTTTAAVLASRGCPYGKRTFVNRVPRN